MSNQREDGCYWVRVYQEWEVAHYGKANTNQFIWTSNGSDQGYIDDDMVEINENRILDPDEQAVHDEDLQLEYKSLAEEF